MLYSAADIYTDIQIYIYILTVVHADKYNKPKDNRYRFIQNINIQYIFTQTQTITRYRDRKI